MANQLKKYYGESIHAVNLTSYRNFNFSEIDKIQVKDKSYYAAYFGEKEMLDSTIEFKKGEFWRLEGVSDEFKNTPVTGEELDYREFPAEPRKGDIWAVDCTKEDGSVERKYYRASGKRTQGRMAAEEIIFE